MEWSLEDANLSDVVIKAGLEGAQFITQQGKRAAVVLSVDAYDKLQESHRNRLMAYAGTLLSEDADTILETLQSSRTNKNQNTLFNDDSA